MKKKRPQTITIVLSDFNDWKKRNAHKQVYKAHDNSKENKAELMASTKCGCYYCCKIYPPNKIKQWISHTIPANTALCPYCGIDSVIGDKSGFPITPKFLEKMSDMWFTPRIRASE